MAKTRAEKKREQNLLNLVKTMTKNVRVVLTRVKFPDKPSEEKVAPVALTKKNRGRNNQKRNIVQKRNIEFTIGQIVWAKLRGFCPWPAQIMNVDFSNMVNVQFFGDRTTAKISKSKLTPFEEGIESYKPQKRPMLEKAVKEALIIMAQQMRN